MSNKCWKLKASRLADRTRNYIREVVEDLDLEPNPDKPLISLSLGDPTVFGNLKPPIEVVEAIKESAESYRHNGYTNSIGYEEARAAVAKYSSTDNIEVKPEDVILCSGSSCALDVSISGLADPGHNILIPHPGFPLYKTLAEGLGIKTKTYKLIPEKSWEVDLYDLESQIDDETAAIVVNNPSNPCGSVYSAQHLQDIVQIASKNCVPIIADEIYEHMVFPGEKYYPIAGFSKDVPILSCSGLTKRFMIPGWRMGWIVIHDRNGLLGNGVRKGLCRLTQRILGSSTLIQGAIPKILQNTPQSFYEETILLLQKHAQIMYSLLSKVDGLHPVMPQGAMYMMVRIDMARFPMFSSTLDFVKQLMTEESIFCLPGECFNLACYMRLVLTLPEDMLCEACRRISEFCHRHYKLQIICPSIIDEYDSRFGYVIQTGDNQRTTTRGTTNTA
ncbi:hypothetical protein AAG570_002022 [Ranatra chinensis]|uniref:Tyrosine aminotransferase n=1 Tax=Ranatra chinensis TaxID=642074 RepID=A0ABD0YP65_9HEMI